VRFSFAAGKKGKSRKPFSTRPGYCFYDCPEGDALRSGALGFTELSKVVLNILPANWPARRSLVRKQAGRKVLLRCRLL
jgi:hypothetical protein